MSDNLVIGGATFTGVTGIKATDTSDNVQTYRNDGIIFDGATSVTVVTVGANSVTNMTNAVAYFSSYTFDLITIISKPNRSNEFTSVFKSVNGNDAATRYKAGKYAITAIGTNYDAVLVEGKKYVVVKW